MKLLQTGENPFQFEINRMERLQLRQVLELYPVVPATHHRLSKGRANSHREENQQLLEDALKLQRQENGKHVVALLNEPKRFRQRADDYQVGFSRGEIEWLLQVLNDVRVGSWIALGSPDEQAEITGRLDPQTMPHVLAMELAGYFEMAFLNAITGRP